MRFGVLGLLHRWLEVLLQVYVLSKKRRRQKPGRRFGPKVTDVKLVMSNPSVLVTEAELHPPAEIKSIRVPFILAPGLNLSCPRLKTHTLTPPSSTLMVGYHPILSSSVRADSLALAVA